MSDPITQIIQAPKTIAIVLNRGEKGDSGGGSGGSVAVTGTAPITAANGAIGILPASGSTPGSMSASDFSKLAAATAANTPGSIVLRDSSGNVAFGTATGNLTGTASNASNLNNQTPAYYLNRANHTGLITSAVVSDFDSQVRSSRLDQFAVPTSAVSLNSQRITGLAAPQNGSDAVNKTYADSLVVSSGLGLLVYAEQNTVAPLSSYVPTIVPFDTEIFDPLNLFASGFFTPTANGIYRVDTLLALNGASPQGRHYVELWTTSSKVLTLFTTDTYVAYTIDTYGATLPLVAGTAYCLKVYSGATDPVVVGSGVKNTLSIERLA